MASIGHIAVGMAAARLYSRGQSTRYATFTSMTLWSCLSLLPDADVIGLRFGVAYADPWGHRGATHSLVLCAALALALGALAPLIGASAPRTALVATLVLVSHPLLDTLTDGGLGCALLWPFDPRRYFASWNPIPVAPIGRAIFSRVGAFVMLTELALFAPLFVYALWPRSAQIRLD
jgi:inner membrane protein